MLTCGSHVRKIDGQLDGLQLSKRSASTTSPELRTTDGTRDSPDLSDQGSVEVDHARGTQLQTAVKAFSTASTSRTLLEPAFILALLRQGGLLSNWAGDKPDEHGSGAVSEDSDLEWLLVSKATNQTYGLVLNLLLDQTIPLSNDIDYWNGVLSSYRYATLYSVQTSPLRLWDWTKDVYGDATQRFQDFQETEGEFSNYARSAATRWTKFYNLVRDSIRERSLTDIQSKFMSPMTISQHEARSKRRRLRRLRQMSGSGIGILVDEGMVLDADDGTSVSSKGRSDDRDEWKSVVAKSVSLMEAVLRNITTSELGLGEFEESVFVTIDEENVATNDENNAASNSPQTVHIASKLEQVLNIHIPAYKKSLRTATKIYGKPSRLVRYWLPGTILFLSSGTLFRVLFKRKAEIVRWIRDSGDTAIDFWYNWVVDPIRKVIGTIRHDKDSEIAIMSKESLKGDQASLERMVVEFATDNPDGGKPLTDAEVAEVRTKVKEGDLTPVLRAYEKDLRRPFIGTIRGDLIRALLIQIQKTKVDVEVAVGGIDNLLKSQELVFGFVGLTPGLLICIGVYRWLNEVVAGRQGQAIGRKQGSLLALLRNIDRILTAATPANNGMLSYKEHGMLLCEAHILRQRAARSLPRDVYHEFLEEIHELVDLRTGVERQLRVVERIRWAYSRYLR